MVAKQRATTRKALGRKAVTLIELLVVISIITLLVALLIPAVSNARARAQEMACQHNMRQLKIGMDARASRFGAYCSGGFSWQWDGAVTEFGWVADLVEQGIPVGEMLCPSNPHQISETYNELLASNSTDWTAWRTCLGDDTFLGSQPTELPDGTYLTNPCRRIFDGADRLAVAKEEIFDKHYNTNYTVSWFLVRGAVKLWLDSEDSNSNGERDDGGTIDCDCGDPTDPNALLSPQCTRGPLTLAATDTAVVSSSFIPIMGCGGEASPLVANLGPYQAGTPTVQMMTRGPVQDDMRPPNPGMAPKKGAGGWWATWNATLQDYRGFAPVHRGACNILFADGSIRSFVDENRDGYLNNGFPGVPPYGGINGNGYLPGNVELPEEQIYSGWSLKEYL